MKLHIDDDDDLPEVVLLPTPAAPRSRRPTPLAEEPAPVPVPAPVITQGPTAVARKLSEKIGEDVKVLPVDLQLIRAAMEEGVLVDVIVRFWRQTVKLQPADLGLATDAEVEAALRQTSTGSVQLIPKDVRDAFGAAETKLRRATRENGFRIDGYRGWFIPAKSWESFQRLYDAGKADFEAALASFCAQLPEHVERVRQHLAELAPRAWVGHRASWDEMGQGQPGQYASLAQPTAAFVEWFALQFTSRIPTAEIIRDYAEVRRVLNVLHVPDVAAAMSVARTNVQLQEAVRDSLEDQRDSLPQRFVESVARSVLGEIQRAFVRISAAGQKRAGAATRALTALKASVHVARERNLTQDPRLTKILGALDVALNTVAARASGAGRAVALDELLAPVKVAIDQLAVLVSLDDGGDE